MDKGYVQVYTGNGKGKTTCMLGLTLRATGAGKRVFIGQFMKDDSYSEIVALREYLPMVTVEQFGAGLGFISKDTALSPHVKAATDGLNKARNALLSGEYDIIILDEINVAVHFGLITVDDILRLISDKPAHIELILTGRYCPQEVIDAADLVTEMCEIKHYYSQGVNARVGIEM